MPEWYERIAAALDHRYDLKKELGGGTVATVYLAEDLKHHRQVAVKVLRPDVRDAIAWDRFLQEIEVATKLNHPNIVPVFDSGNRDGLLYYVMPFQEGESLLERLEREGRLPLAEAVTLAKEVAEALEYAHSHGVIHRDIKPANILLSGGHALVTDFGVAKAVSNSVRDRMTVAGMALGTPAYMSPEQAAGMDNITPSSDIYSLGCVLYEMLGGEPPFPGKIAQSIIARHINEPPLSLGAIRHSVPKALENAVKKALAKAPADRFESAAEFQQRLSDPRLLDEEEGRAGVSGRQILVRTLVVLVAILMVAGGLWTWVQRRTPSLDPDKVLVFPLNDRSGGTEEGTDVSYVIYWALEHSEPLKWINGWRRLSASQREDIRRLTEVASREIAMDEGAGYFIDGAVVRLGDSISVSLLLHDTEGDSTVAEVRRVGHENETRADRLGLEATIHLLPPIVDPERPVDLSYLLDRDPGAIALWIQGEREYRQAHWEPALELYQRAVAADSNLSFAAIKGAQAAGWAEEPESGQDLVEVALASEDLLPRKYRMFGRAFLAYVEGRADEAVRYSREALAEDPDWEEAWTLLGETYHHLLPSDLDVDTSAASAFMRAAELDSTFVPPLIHLTEYALQAGNFSQAEEFVRRLEGVGASETNLAKFRVMDTCLRGGSLDLDWLVVARNDTVALINAADHLTERGVHLACAEEAYRQVLQLDSPADLSFGAIVGLQGILAVQNRAEDLTRLLNQGAKITPAAKLYFLLDEFAGAQIHAESEAFVEFVRELTGGTFQEIQPRTQWMLGTWLAYHGTDEEFRAVEKALEDMQPTGSPEILAFTSSLSAHRALVRGDTTMALVLLGSIPLSSTRQKLRWDLGGGFPVEIMQLAKLYLARQEPQQAIRWARLIDHPQSFSYVPFLAESLRVRYQAAEELGDSSLLAQYRQRLFDLGRIDLIEGAGAP